MPELPEVETVKNSLKDFIIGRTIKSVDVYYERIIQNVSIDEFKKALVDETFIDIERIGKYLIFILKNHIMVAHLRMEGKYFLRDLEERTKHEHIIFNLTDGKTLRYNDTRKFGVIYLFYTNKTEDVKRVEPLNKLGIDPTSGLLTKEYLKEMFCKCKRPIKTVLLDQNIICGIGNIYADEVCFMSGLNPLIKASDLPDESIEKILESTIIVLNKAIKLGGTTIKSFVSSHEISGRFQNELLVHTKIDCPYCNQKIKKIYVGGRGTYYCPNCQR